MGGSQNLRQQLAKEIDSGRYAAALETLTKIVEQKGQTPEDLYYGAYAYFMLGDYERAASFVNNTLSYAPQHVKSRILLARICIVEDRTEDALKVLNGLLAPQEVLTAEEEEEIRDLTEYYGNVRREDIRSNYPHIARFLGLNGENMGAKLPQAPVAVPSSVTVLSQEDAGEVTAGEVAAKIQEINERPVSLERKVKMLQKFAGGYYVAGEITAAELMLKAALRLDAEDDESLKGMALVTKAKGDPEKALKFAVAMSYTDFTLLTLLKAR